MTRNTLATVLVALSFLAPARAGYGADAASAQKPVAAAAEEFFSGTVTQFTDRSLTVVHKVAGQPAVTREFTRDEKTTIEGKLRGKVRVTVRYKALAAGGFVAVHIIVRAARAA